MGSVASPEVFGRIGETGMLSGDGGWWVHSKCCPSESERVQAFRERKIAWSGSKSEKSMALGLGQKVGFSLPWGCTPKLCRCLIDWCLIDLFAI